MKENVTKQEIIYILFNIEQRPEMYGPPKEIEATVDTLYSLLLNDDEFETFRNFKIKLIRKLLGTNVNPSIPFSYQIKEYDYGLMIEYLKQIRNKLGILEEMVDNPK